MANSLHDRDATALRWLKWLVVSTLGVLALVLATSYWLLSTEAGARWLLARAESATDGAIQVTVLQGDLRSGLELRGATWRSSEFNADADRLTVSADIGLFPLEVRFTDVTAENVDIHRVSSDAPEGATLDADLRDDLRQLALPVRLHIDNLLFVNIGLHQDGNSVAQIDELQLGATWAESLTIGRFALQMPQVAVHGEGTVNFASDQSFNAVIDASGFGVAEHKISLVGVPQQAGYDFTHIAIDGAVVALDGGLVVDWERSLSIGANLSVLRFDLHSVFASWPADNPLSGNLAVSLQDNQLTVTQAHVSAANSDVELHSEGFVDFSTAEVNGLLQWSDLQWPLGSIAPQVVSEAAKIRLAGHLDQWTISGDVDIATSSTPSGSFSIDANGDREHAEIAILSGAVIGGQVTGNVAYRWHGPQLWSASLDLDQIAVGELWPEWPGIVSGQLSARGSSATQETTIEIDRIEGELRNRSLQVSGGLFVTPDTIVANKLSIDYGQSSALLSGAPDIPAGLAYVVEVNSLREIVSDAVGDFRAQGSYRGANGDTHLALRLDSEQLQYADIALTDIRIRDASENTALLHSNISIAAASVADQTMEAITAETKITPQAQHLDLAFTVEGVDAQVMLAGALDNWRDGLQSIWRGELSALAINIKNQQTLQLEKPMPIELAQDRVVFDNGCLRGTLGSRVCASALWHSGRLSSGDIRLGNLPLSLVNRFMSTGLDLDQRLSGELEWSSDPHLDLSAKGSLSMTAGRLQSLHSEELLLRTGPGTVLFDITDGELLSGSMNLPLPENGIIAGEFTVADVAASTQSDVTGSLQVAISDISMLAHFSPLVDGANGDLQADLMLSGTVSEPRLTGRAELKNGEIEYLPIGLDLREINLTAGMSPNQNTKLQGTFRSGDGVGELTSAAGFGEDDVLAVEFDLKGDRLTLVDVPDLHAVIDADLTIAYAPEEVQLGGNLTVVKARVRPNNLVNASVVESNDVVIVAGALPEATIKERDEDTMKVFGDVEVSLGDDVSFEVSVANATASGSARFKWSGGKVPMANGRYDLRGQVQAFGQVLDIAEGRVRFADEPANNPYLRIRAERDIFGNTQVKKAGVFVEGFASSPRVQTYTTPLTTEERALTLIATGSDFDYEQGVGAIDFGTYIAPRLFVSYGVSLFGRDNVISARYDLSKGFGIKATSGSTESGVDLSYRFEN